MDGQKIVYRGGEGRIEEKKSRFIATVVPVKSEEEALEFIAKMKKKYWDATHNCSAFVIGEGARLQRCSDDGEPQGTAGRPMLDVLLGAKNCIITPHISWAAKEARQRIMDITVENVRAFLAGEPVNVVNP